MLFNAGGVVENVVLVIPHEFAFLMNLHSIVAASDATSIVFSVVMVFGFVLVLSLQRAAAGTGADNEQIGSPSLIKIQGASLSRRAGEI